MKLIFSHDHTCQRFAALASTSNGLTLETNGQTGKREREEGKIAAPERDPSIIVRLLGRVGVRRSLSEDGGDRYKLKPPLKASRVQEIKPAS